MPFLNLKLTGSEIVPIDGNWYNDDAFDYEHHIFLGQPPSNTFEPNSSDFSMPTKSTGIQAVGDALQSETSGKASDKYQPTKLNSTSTTNPPLLVPQDLPGQSAILEVGADNGMGLVLFNNDRSSQEAQPSIRKRFKAVDGNVIPLPHSAELLHWSVDQFANATANPVISLAPAISAAISDPHPNVHRIAGTNGIQRFWDSVPTLVENGIPSLSNGLQRVSRQDLPDTVLSNGQVELLAPKSDPEPPISGVGLTITAQRR